VWTNSRCAAERGVPSWLLAQKSRTYRSQEIGVRAGASYTRWTVPEDKAQYLGKDWHGLTVSKSPWPAQEHGSPATWPHSPHP
jgi:hypothetical protein